MELILLQDVEKVGRKGEVVRVRDGFARNVLIPRKLALAATDENQTFVEEHKKRAEIRREKEKAAAQAQADKISSVKLKIEAQAGEQEKLFGAVTSEEIAEALAKKGYEVDKKQIQMKDAIKTLGIHHVSVEIYPQVKASVSVEVIRKA